MIQYKLEWLYKNGQLHYSYANTLEMAEMKAKPFLNNDNIIIVTITKCELLKTLKDVE